MNGVLVRGALLVLSLAVGWNEPSPYLSLSAQETVLISSVPQVAFAGRVRSGYWAGVRLLPGSAQAIRAVDGLGLEVNYPLDPVREWGYWKVGPRDSEVWVIDENDQSQLLDVKYLTHSRSGENSWFVGLGTDLGLSSINADIIGHSEEGGAISIITSATEVPDHRLGWDGVDLVVLSTSQTELLSQLSQTQTDGLIEWLRQGGRLLFDCGPEISETLRRCPWLSQLFNGQEDFGEPVTAEPAPIEVFASSRDPLQRLKVVSLPSGGRGLLEGRTVDRQSVRLVAEYLCGFGRVTAVGLNLTAEPLEQWPGRNRLMRKLIPELFDQSKVKKFEATNRTLGYEDIAGQIRASLDRPSRSRPPFSWLVGLLLVYLAVIGPLDYFLINRWLKKPLLGWVTFPAIVLATAGGLIQWSRAQRADQPQIRKIEVVDFAPTEKIGRGYVWAQIEASSSGVTDIQIEELGELTHKQPAPILTAWQGVAGPVFGGVNAVGALPGMPAYRLTVARTADGLSSEILESPVASGGSRSVVGTWNYSDTALELSSLRQLPGTELVRGQLVNPLQVDLLEPYLIYRTSVYALPTRLPAGAKVSDLERIRPKNFNWRLTRRQLREGASESAPWDAAMTDNLPRIMEIMLFHEIAGGSTYTGLRNRPLQELDLSYALGHDRAILVGRLSGEASQLADLDGASLGEVVEQLTYCRIVLPVAKFSTADPEKLP